MQLIRSLPKERKEIQLLALRPLVAVAIAAIIVAGILGGCGGDNAKSNDDVDSGEHAQQAVSSEEQKEKTLEDYTWEELSKISEEIGNAPDEGAAIEIAKGYKLTTEDGKLDGTRRSR